MNKRTDPYVTYKVDVPESKSGEWSVKRFTVTPADEALERIRIFSNRGRYVPAGTYTGLFNSNGIVMSDTPDEIRDHLYFIHTAKGRVLINGLGLGMALNAILMKSDVEHVTVIEKSPDVIKLVGRHYFNLYGSRLTIRHADALEWQPPKGVRYNSVWHDIWEYVNSDVAHEMTKLRRKYGRRTDWQGCWGEDMLSR